MGLFWLESFEARNLMADKINANGTKYTASNWNSGSARTGGTFGTSATLRLGAGDQDDLIIAGGAWLVPGSGAGTFYIASLLADAGATRHVSLYITRTAPNAPATLKVYRGDSAGTLLGSFAFTEPPAATWVHFELKARLHDTTGSVVVRMDEVVVINLAGVDTKNGGTAAVFDTIEFSNNWSNGVDDLYACNEQGSVNTDFLGAIRVEALDPNGNGATSNGVGSDGNSVDNYALLEETPTGSTASYVDLNATGDKDTYAHENSGLPTGNAVKGVMVWADAQKTDAGARTITPVARLSGVEVDGAALALLNGTYKGVGDVFQTKPGGGGWTVADVNAAEFGVKAT